jgi:hypothetical protein
MEPGARRAYWRKMLEGVAAGPNQPRVLGLEEQYIEARENYLQQLDQCELRQAQLTSMADDAAIYTGSQIGPKGQAEVELAQMLRILDSKQAFYESLALELDRIQTAIEEIDNAGTAKT